MKEAEIVRTDWRHREETEGKPHFYHGNKGGDIKEPMIHRKTLISTGLHVLFSYVQRVFCCFFYQFNSGSGSILSSIFLKLM